MKNEARQLVFKGVSLDTGEWVEGYGVCLEKVHSLAAIFSKQGSNLMQSTAVHPDSICQYTGIAYIFERDEISSPENQIRGYVEFNEGAFSLKITMSNNETMDVGQSIPLFDFDARTLSKTSRNTYDNPEVFKPKKDD